jgi:hypothetical protein
MPWQRMRAIQRRPRPVGRDLAEKRDEAVEMFLERLLRPQSAGVFSHGQPYFGVRQRRERLGKFGDRVGGLDHESLAARRDELAGAVEPRRDDRQPAGERLEHDERTGIEVRGQNEVVGRADDWPNIGLKAKEMDVAANIKTIGQASKWRRVSTAADREMQRLAAWVTLAAALESAQQRSQPLQPKVMGEEEREDVGLGQAQATA